MKTPSRFPYFFSSPFARHPSLIWRKLTGRLRNNSTLVFKPISGGNYSAPDAWRTQLREWTAAVKLTNTPFPSNWVFQQKWDYEVLYSACRGRPSATDGLAGDIKLVWEFSRGYFLVVEAARTNNGNRDAVAGQLAGWIQNWIDHNGDPDGVNWICAMEVAIRAVNWIAADVLLEGRLKAAIGPEKWTQQIWNHGHAIWTRLEARIIGSNHYLANIMGLAWIGAALNDHRDAKKWLRFARRELPAALNAQLNRDGGAYEGSLPYHALYTEITLLTLLALGSPHDRRTIARLNKMTGILRALRRPNGDLWPIGDDDDGRVLALDLASKTKRTDVILELAGILLKNEMNTTLPETWFPASGWWMGNSGKAAAFVSFGGASFHGWGGHSHNDQLAVCIDDGPQPILVDPGTYLYTSDLGARRRYRSTASHNTLMLDECEHRPMPPEKKQFAFQLIGSTKPAIVRNASGSELMVELKIPSKSGEISFRRTVTLNPGDVIIRDRIGGTGLHDCAWRFLIDPSVHAKVNGQGWRMNSTRGGTYRLTTSVPMSFFVEPAFVSPFYGKQENTLMLVANVNAALPMEVEWRLTGINGMAAEI